MDPRQCPVIVLGDLHGRKDLLIKCLTDIGLIDDKLAWCGGNRQLIQLGDVVDRGPESLAALDLLMRLQAEARAAGGEVTCLLGNHELLALRSAAGDHADRLFWAMIGGDSVYREWCFRVGQEPRDTEPPYPEDFYALFARDGTYGRWLHTHLIACRVGNYVAVHAGWPADGPVSLAAANAMARLDLPPRERLLWVREHHATEVAQICHQLGVQGLIAGHTIVWGIKVSANRQLIQIDTGMVATGIWVAVGIDHDGRLWALMDGAEPRLIAADGLMPLPIAGKFPARVPPTPLFQPGTVIKLYEAADGTWAYYMHIDDIVEQAGLLTYTGEARTWDGAKWQHQPVQWQVDLVDPFGRPVPD